MRAAVALLLSLSLVGCFKNPTHRTFAKIGEGVAIVGGIVLLASVNTGADCEEGGVGVMPDQDCKDRASLISNIGLGLILAGMIGFVVTVSTSDEDSTTTAPTATPKAPAPAEPAAPATPTPTPAPTPTPTTSPEPTPVPETPPAPNP